MSFDQIDYRHYLDQNKLKESDGFQPVFEAVENAFNAIEERLRLEPGSPDGLRDDHYQPKSGTTNHLVTISHVVNSRPLKLLALSSSTMGSAFAMTTGPHSRLFIHLTRNFTAVKALDA